MTCYENVTCFMVAALCREPLFKLLGNLILSIRCMYRVLGNRKERKLAVSVLSTKAVLLLSTDGLESNTFPVTWALPQIMHAQLSFQRHSPYGNNNVFNT